MTAHLDEALADLREGSFSKLAPLCEGDLPIFSKWVDEGGLGESDLAELLTCAAFNGCIPLLRLLLAKGVNPSQGTATGMGALHWAANRGQVEAVQMLLEAGADAEAVNSYGGTPLEQAVWSHFNESAPGQVEAIRLLTEAGADTSRIQRPTGDPQLDAIFS